MSKTTVQQLSEIGQSVWVDYISRALIDTGKLKGLINVGVQGLTSNPSIFDKAISSSEDYDKNIKELKQNGKTAFEIYDDLTVKDIQDAADIFGPIYDKTDGLDGYVSLEINPKLSYDIEETIAEGRRLHQKVDRPNLLLKVPSTKQGFKAIEELLGQGISVNVTLIFSLQQYIDTAQAYIKGVQRFLQKNGDIRRLSSVASVFVSRVDTQVDRLLDEMIERESRDSDETLTALKGKAAVANSGIIYSKYREIFSSQEFKELQNKGARIQRLLWGSTSTKNPVYSDIKYVAELIGENTINTIPEKTLTAFLDHGIAQKSLSTETAHHQDILDQLNNLDIDINKVCNKLLDDGVKAFEKSFDALLNAIIEKSKKL